MPVVDAADTAVRIEPEQYPWHDGQWAALTRDLARLPHAVLLHGQAGLGKNAFALRLAQMLLCLQRVEGRACGRCRSCSLFRVGNHPDLLRVGPLEDSRNILVDQVRGVVEFLTFKAHTAAHKIVLVSPADAMNVSAANSLLKILEEPPPGSLLILAATHLTRVPATIRSRCTRVAFQVPAQPETLAWLQAVRPAVGPNPVQLLTQAGGAPLAALALASEGVVDTQRRLAEDLGQVAQKRVDPLVCAERWKTVGAEICLGWLHRSLSDTLCSQGKSSPLPASIPVNVGNNILYISIIDLFIYLDNVSISRRQLGTGIDETLMLEHLLIRWCEMTESGVRN